jgi:glutaminyl-peptide cyclotransferase
MHCSKAIALALWAALACAADSSGESALRFTVRAVEFGPRPSGSEANAKLQTYIQTQLKSFGCTVQEDAFTTDTPLGPKKMKNIIVKLPGSSGKAVVITGHYDTKVMPLIQFVGANDGGSSTGLLLELARALAKAPRKDDIYLVWFDGEEAVAEWSDTDSLYGSRHLAEKWGADGTLTKVKALINVDMIGDKDLKLVRDPNSTDWLRDLFWKTAADLGYSAHLSNLIDPISDDHMPFLRRGVQALDLIDFDYGPNNGYWHTEQDTVDKLSAASFDVMGKVLIEALHRLETK